MKAAILEQLCSPLRVTRDLGIPPLKSGQLLVKLAYSGVCHSQLMEIHGKRGPDRYLPHLLGHEGSGVVIATGEGVNKVAKGDKVILGWIKGRGLDVAGSQYKSGSQIVNAGAVTTFNEFAVVSENRCVLLPEGIPMDVAVLFGCAIPTGAGIITNTIQPAAGATIAIFGLGGIGLSALMACRIYECSQIIAIDIQDEKLDLARELGATLVINSMKQDPLSVIMEETSGKGVDYSVESAGLVSTIEQAFSVVRREGGLCVFSSHPKNGDKISLDPYDLICGKRLMGSWGGDADPDRDIPRFAQLYREGRLPLEKLITRRYKLDEINQALEDLESHKAARPLIEIDPLIG